VVAAVAHVLHLGFQPFAVQMPCTALRPAHQMNA
jgi:hypothetical protein